MKKVCGITIKGSEIITVILEGDTIEHNVISSPFEKFKLSDSKDQSTVKSFRQKVLDFFDYQDFHAIGIKERMAKGRFAGGAITFKIEGLLQTSDYPVNIIHSNSIKAKTKNAIIDMDSVKVYQQDALLVAYYLLQAE